MNDQEFLNVMADLKFIGSVEENQYINLTNQTIENKNFVTTLIRKYYYNYLHHKTENGTATAKYCSAVIIRSFKLLDRYTNQKERHNETHEYAKIIQRYIEQAKIGMDHLKETHRGNNMAFAIFDSISVAIIQRTNGSTCCGEKIPKED